MSKKSRTTWSKLKKTAENLFVPGLMLELRSTVYRCLPSSHSPGTGRFWVVLDKEVIWDVTKDYPKTSRGWNKSPYTPFNQICMGLLHRYVSTPVADLSGLRIPDQPKDCQLCKNFIEEYGERNEITKKWETRSHYRDHIIINELLDILLMADRRISKRKKKELLKKDVVSQAAKLIWAKLNGASGPFRDLEKRQKALQSLVEEGH